MPTFGGDTFDPERDEERLRAQYRMVFNFMLDGLWHTLREVSGVTGHPEASVSARFRDMRKKKFGAHTVERRYVSRGLFEYRLIPNRPAPTLPPPTPKPVPFASFA